MSGSSGKSVASGRRRQPAGKKPEADRVEGAARPAPPKGGILKALRRSPLVGEDIVPHRRNERGRKVDL